VGLEGIEVDLDHEVVILLRILRDLRVGGQQVLVGLGQGRDARPLGGVEVDLGAIVVGEDRGCGAELGAHVGDGALAGGRDRICPRSEVLDDAVGAALDRENSEELEDHVLGRRPPVQAAGELDADDFRLQDLPVETGHHIHRVGPADADRDHPETAGVGGVGVGTDHHPAGEGVVFEDHLVDDPGAWLPEADAVAG